MARLFWIFAVVVSVFVTNLFAAAEPTAGVGLTVYNDNFAVVKERRNMDFAAGVTTVKFTDVATAIDPTSVTFECLSVPGAVSILEQNYEYDLANTDSLLKRYIDKKVRVQIRGSGSDGGRGADGTLVSSQGGNIILQVNNGGMEIIDRSSIEAVSLTEMPADLVTKPTLVWLAQTQEAGSKLCQVTYTTGAISWKADYTAVLSGDEKAIDISGWVTIDNKSGAGYKDATIKLIAGDVRRVQEVPRPMAYAEDISSLRMAKALRPLTVLRAVTERMRATLREADMVGRLGGEEFAIVLEGTELPGARILAERIRERVAEKPCEHGDAQILVTLSQGIAEFTGDESLEALMARADAALYAAKRAGRNRVSLQDGRRGLTLVVAGDIATGPESNLPSLQ